MAEASVLMALICKRAQAAKGQSRRNYPKMASRPFQFLEKNAPKSEGERGLAALSTHSAAVKTRWKPVHFSLDGCPLSCYFSGSVATLRDTSPFAKIQPVFLPEQTGRMKDRAPFAPSATPAGITHYTLQAKSCAKGQASLEIPDNKTGGMLPSPGAYRRLLSAARFTVC